MTGDDVHPSEMDEPHDLDDAATDALLTGAGRDADSRLADPLGDMRVAYTSTPPAIGTELSALITAGPPGPTPSFVARRFEQMRSSILAKIGVAAAAVMAATGGLAAANALPAPVQDAVSHLGAPAASRHDASPSTEIFTTTDDTSETTPPADPTPTTEPNDNHGGEVSAVAHDRSTEGCDHGDAVSAVASDARASDGPHDDAADPSNEADAANEANEANDRSCDTTTTVDSATPTTVEDNRDGDTSSIDESGPTNDGHDRGSSHDGDGNPSGSDGGGSSGSGGSD